MESTNVMLYKRWISVIGLLLIGGMIAYYIYLLRIGEAQRLMSSIRHFGYSGILIGIVFQAMVNILPVPGEFTSIALMEIYGPVMGGVYSFIGGIIGALGGLYLSRWVAKPFFSALAAPYVAKVEEWLKKREQLGLLLIRFIPLVPYHFVNYAAGLLDVNIWAFTWTTALGILPYTIAMSGIYAGVRQGSLLWGAVGGGIFLILAGIGWMVRRGR
ncbi:TVP38/TMEM64 family protein [Paenibacillus cremeus]|uniref:TVP38/TMEM64 family membrane protein n=1 Tax=Paenibacillus cremeus TaxID=2163881 RepID=A0A559KAP3_9BACL|nr:VTT domain-containing protein [Paenibacillus cremeus]TVY09169.1 TVP38/TMEM64 family protein [Paenibacillus cremeus]